MNWALKRQIIYVIVLILVLSFFGFLLIRPSLDKPPSCTDGNQNGDETGVDCGGSCPYACTDQVSPVSVLWARAFEVVHGRYNAVAYLVNHNKNAAVESVSYRFRFADANNVYIGKREGITFIPPGENFAIFEPAIDVGNSVPVYTTFEFTETPLWLQVPQSKLDQLKVTVSNIELADQTTSPKLGAAVNNNSIFTIPNVNVVAILYDVSSNAVSASSTYIPELDPLQNTNINFTWPQPFQTNVVAEELIPMYDIFSAELK